MIIHIDDRDAFITVIEHADAGTKYRSSYCSASPLMSDTQPACKRSDLGSQQHGVLLFGACIMLVEGE